MRSGMARDDVVVGFIGLGIMGGRMAANLQKAGYNLVVHDLRRQAASHHLNAGAVLHLSSLTRTSRLLMHSAASSACLCASAISRLPI